MYADLTKPSGSVSHAWGNGAKVGVPLGFLASMRFKSVLWVRREEEAGREWPWNRDCKKGWGGGVRYEPMSRGNGVRPYSPFFRVM